MITVTKALIGILKRAKAKIEKRGWVQHSLKNSNGYCLYGAIAYSSQDEKLIDTADTYIAELLDDNIVEWNDSEGRTKKQVLAKLNLGISKAEREYNANN